MKGRNISCNIRRILDIIQFAEEEDLPGLIISLDFEKCFDRIEVSSLIGALAYFNFGESFIKWTKLIYSRPIACVTNNGYFSNYFNVERSVKQGGCCSAYYFLIIAEVLAIELTQGGANIKGIKVRDIEKFFGQFADDLDIYIHSDTTSLSTVFSIIDNFCRHSGFRVNYNKMTIYRIGSLRHSNVKLFLQRNLTWTDTVINILGVYVCHDTKNLCDLNYPQLIQKAEAICSSWEHRGISLYGKVIVINTLIASLFVYRMSVLPAMPQKYVNQLNKLMESFIWNNKKPKISLRVLQNSVDEGGLNLVNFRNKDRALKASWVRTIKTYSFLQNIMKEALKIPPAIEVFSCNLKKQDIIKIYPQCFWRDVIEAYSLMNYEESEEITDVNKIGAQCIWLNSNIKVNGKVLCNVKVINEGLMHVCQLMDLTSGKVLPVETLANMFQTTIMYMNQLILPCLRNGKN